MSATVELSIIGKSQQLAATLQAESSPRFTYHFTDFPAAPPSISSAQQIIVLDCLEKPPGNDLRRHLETAATLTHRGLPFIVINDDEALEIEALRWGAYACIRPPHIMEKLALYVDRLTTASPDTAGLDMLAQISHLAAHTPASDENTIHDMMKVVIRDIGADWCSLNLVEGEHFIYYLIAGLEEQFTVRPRADGLSQCAMQQRQPVLIPDTLADERFHPAMIERGIRAAICLPLVIDGAAIGAFWVHYNTRQTAAYFEGLLGRLQVAVDFISLALRKIRLQRGNELARQAAIKLAHKTIETEEGEALQPLLQMTVDETQRVLEADTVVLYSYNTLTHRFDYPPTISDGLHHPEYHNQFSRVKPTSLVNHLLQRFEHDRTPYFAHNTSEDPLFSGRTFVRNERVKSCIVWPLHVAERIVGIMFVNYRSAQVFRPESDRIANLDLFTDQAAYAIYTSQLYQSRLQQVRALQVVIEASETVNARMDSADNEIVLRQVVRSAWEIMADSCQTHMSFIGLVNPDEPEIIDFVAAEPTGAMERLIIRNRRSVSINDKGIRLGITGRAIKHGQTQHVADTQQEIDYWQEYPDTRSVLSVAIRSGDETLGAVSIQHPEPYAFDRLHIGVLETLAKLTAIALKNARNYAAQQAALQRTETLYNVAQAVASSELDLQSTLDEVVEQVGRITTSRQQQAALCQITLEKNGGWISPPQAVYKHDSLTASPENSHDWVRLSGQLQAAFAVPVYHQRQITGAINIGYQHPQAFAVCDVELLGKIADFVAIEISKAQDYEKLSRSHQHRQAIHQTSKLISGGLGHDRSEWLSQILHKVVEEFRFARGERASMAVIQAYDSEQDMLYFRSAYPAQRLREFQERFNGGERILGEGQQPIGISGRAVRSRRTQPVPDVTVDPDYLMFDATTRSEVDVPLVMDDRVIGVMTLESDVPDAFDDSDVAALEALAELLVIAYRNTQLYEDLRRYQGIIGTRTALAWMGMTSDIWRHSITGHAINIRNEVRHLRQMVTAGRIQTSQDELVGQALETSEQMAEAIINLPITPPLMSDSAAKVLDVGQIIRDRVEQLWRLDHYQQLPLPTITQEAGPHYIRMSQDWLRYALDNLLDNARWAMLNSTTKALSIHIQPHTEHIEVIFEDTGSGIPSQIQDLLAQTSPDTNDNNEMGMGLLIVQAILEVYGGKIEIKHTGSTGTAIGVWLPRYNPA